MQRLFCTTLVAIGIMSLSAAPALAQKDWGVVKGKILFKGPEQKPEEVKIDKDVAFCTSQGKIFREDWVVDAKTKGLRDVFVWLAPLEKDGKLPVHPSLKTPAKKEVVIDQPCCSFVPHALAMREGQNLIVKNSAAIVHNFRWIGHPFTNGSGNIAIPPGKQHVIETFKADYRVPVTVKCDVHGWMGASIRVFGHPYYALTGKDGSFEIAKAPAGKYRLFVWHPSGGWLGGEAGRNGREITISADGTTTLEPMQMEMPND